MTSPDLTIKDFDYHLPPELVAQYPARRRADARMLVVRRTRGDGPPGPSQKGSFLDSQFRDLPRFLEPSDMLVVNNSRVLPARLFGYRAGVCSQPIGKRNPARGEYLRSPIEALLVRQMDERTWKALVKPGRKVRLGEKLVFYDAAATEYGELQKEKGRQMEGITLEAEVIGRGEYGLRILRFPEGIPLAEMLERVGHVPLPPYIRRPDEKQDRLRYQTV
ncbi:MAG: S-adenosylmethionine:tRNA ribosyltransferase-isomerase, partial [Acidobacteria bacterium]|nr:S-adenosylmethionine:tRNA ribosyltransferase-isomerase [Acidobacteriota bacterium]